MRRPVFSRWIRTEVQRIATSRSFSLRRFSALSQTDKAPGELSAALLLYAYENDCVDSLFEYIYDEKILEEYKLTIDRLGGRSVSQLALRGTPMKSLGENYRVIMKRFADAYYHPERVAEEKRAIWEQAREAQLRTGATPSQIATALDIDPANVSAFLKNGRVEKFTLEKSQMILDYLNKQGK